MSAFTERGLRATASFAIALLVAGCSSPSGSPTPRAALPSSEQQLTQFKQKIDHFVFIYQENWGFDSLYGKFPGANGYGNATSITQQIDANGAPISVLPAVLKGSAPDPAFAALNASKAPVAPFDETTYVPTTGTTGDPNHNFFLQQAQIDGGRMDRYLAYAGPGQGGLTFGYVDATNLPEGKLAQQYVLADNFHQDAFGGSFLNNMYAACACAPQVPLSAIGNRIEPLDANGNPIALGGSEGRATADGYIVNTSFTAQYPEIAGPQAEGVPPGSAKSLIFVPPLTNPTLGDRLSAANVSWKYYSGGLDQALTGGPVANNFQPHHQSYLYFANYAKGTPGATHVVDDSNFVKDLNANALPAVSWVKPVGNNNEHPGYTNVATGQMYVANLVSQIQMSPAWKDTMIVIFYDEAGGHYDHVAPTPTDRFGPSTRVPAIFISPFAKRGYIDHTNLTVASLLKTVEVRYDLAPLTDRDANATPLIYSAFDFTQALPNAFARKSLGYLPIIPSVQAVVPSKGPLSGTNADYDE